MSAIGIFTRHCSNFRSEKKIKFLNNFPFFNMGSFNKWIDKKVNDDDINYFEYDEFSNVEKVGEGGFGVVNRADWESGGIKVALKILTNINEDKLNKEVTFKIFNSI